jgi:hypothetical protein
MQRLSQLFLLITLSGQARSRNLAARNITEGVELSKGRATIIQRQRASFHFRRSVLNGAT